MHPPMITAIVNTIAMATQFGKFDINSTILSTEFAPKTKIAYMCINVYVMVKMLVIHFAVTVIFAHQIVVLVTSMRLLCFGRLVAKAHNVMYTNAHTFCWLHQRCKIVN